jgi:hypothetical protein
MKTESLLNVAPCHDKINLPPKPASVKELRHGGRFSCRTLVPVTGLSPENHLLFWPKIQPARKGLAGLISKLAVNYPLREEVVLCPQN